MPALFRGLGVMGEAFGAVQLGERFRVARDLDVYGPLHGEAQQGLEALRSTASVMARAWSAVISASRCGSRAATTSHRAKGVWAGRGISSGPWIG
ncbi:hypothetical protein [Kitasatospora sp. NPDC051914]|uniref:hypothetical protein n=1 Tax=Kitasatospora sp. NPDC051914 TaxID=3154945 RepID=UPI0034127625